MRKKSDRVMMVIEIVEECENNYSCQNCKCNDDICDKFQEMFGCRPNYFNEVVMQRELN